jgi:transaldolase
MIKIYLDGANSRDIEWGANKDNISGFTTNPTLMKQDGVTDYKSFALDAIAKANEKPISFEVFVDDVDGIIEQAQTISSWGKNVYVKVPVINTAGLSTEEAIKRLSEKNVKLNITAVFTPEQAKVALNALGNGTGIISVFAGRISDAGQNAGRIAREISDMAHDYPCAKVLWASTREIYNTVEAWQAGCDIITVARSMIEKAEKTVGKDLTQYSLETVQMFYNDSQSAGYKL